MKVLHVINNLGSGGAESMLLNFVKEAKQLNQAHEILLLVNDKVSYDYNPDIKINILSESTSRYSIFKLFQLCKFIKKNNFDIIHSHLFPSQYYVALCKIILWKQIKIVTTEHNTTNNRRKYKLTKFLDKLIYNLYDQIIYISKSVKNQFINDFPKLSQKGIVIHNGIPLSIFNPIEKPKVDNIFKLIMVASFTEQKDHLTLLKAMTLLDNKYHLSLVGEGIKMEYYKKFVIENNLNSRVSFLGFKKNINKLYNEHDVFILSSHWEGFGLVAVEAMASGLPVITSDVEGLKNVVENAGLLFKKNNPQDLANKIIALSTNPDLYQTLKERGIQKAKSYDIKNLVKKTIATYNKLNNKTELNG